MTRSSGVIAAAMIMSLALTGCAYRLYATSPPSQHRLTIIGKSPEQYTVHIQARDYPVAADGQVTFDFPAVRRACGVYLFDAIPINRGADPFKAKTIAVTSGRKVVQTFSLNDISKLPVDSSGHHLLNLNNYR